MIQGIESSKKSEDDPVADSAHQICEKVSKTIQENINGSIWPVTEQNSNLH